MTDAEEPIARMLEAYKAAVFAKDVEALMSLYDPDVRVFDAWGQWSYDGVQAWRGMVARWLGSLATERVVVDLDEVQKTVTQDVAIIHAFATYACISAEGNARHATRNRLTWVLRRRAGGWRVVHEHTSVPVDFRTSTAIR